jgi:hypothetical protein
MGTPSINVSFQQILCTQREREKENDKVGCFRGNVKKKYTNSYKKAKSVLLGKRKKKEDKETLFF